MSLRVISSVSRVARRLNFSRSMAIFSQKSSFSPVPILCNNKISFVMALNYSTKPDIATYEEIKNLPKNPETLLIDVREPQELAETGSVPTSINIPLGQIQEKLSNDFSPKDFEKLFGRKKPSFDTEIIYMCKIGGRSQKALDTAKQLGYKNGRNYLGSWQDWAKHEGLPPQK